MPFASQHATILQEARNSLNGFSATMSEAKHACPLDRPDIRALVSTLERASKTLTNELGRSISRLRALDGLPDMMPMENGFDLNFGLPYAGFPAVSEAAPFMAPNQFGGLPGMGMDAQQPMTLATLGQIGFTPNVLEALNLHQQQQQPFGNQQPLPPQPQPQPQPNGSAKTSGATTPTEPSRKKRKHGRSKLADSPNMRHSLPLPSPPSASPGPALPPRVAPQPSKRVSTLGVGLRQEGDKRYRNRKLLRDLREHLYRWLGTNEFRKLKNTYKVAEWVPVTEGGSSVTHIFHVDFTSRDFYRTNQALIDAIVMEGSKKVEARPEAYDIVPGTIDRDHLEDVAKDLMDSARSGFRMSLRTGVQAEKEDKEKHEKYRGVERAKTKCRNREIGAARLRHSIPRQLLVPGAYSDDAASDEDLHGLTKSEWKRQRLRKLRIAKGWEAVTPAWRNKHLTKAYHKADIVSKSKQMARWRRDTPVDLPFPIKLYGKTLPAQLFDPDWLAENRRMLEDEPYFVKIDEGKVKGWEESHHPLGEDTSDELEWSDAPKQEVKEPKRGVSEEEVGASSTSGGVEQESGSGEASSSSGSEAEGL